MQNLMEVLCSERTRLEEKRRSGEILSEPERTDCEKRLETVMSDIGRLEMVIDRPAMQTFSELHFIDDIRSRVREIEAGTGN